MGTDTSLTQTLTEGWTQWTPVVLGLFHKTKSVAIVTATVGKNYLSNVAHGLSSQGLGHGTGGGNVELGLDGQA
jgi:hypothetical protein